MPTKKQNSNTARREATKDKTIEQIAKQVTATRKRPDVTVQTEEGDNAKYLNHNIELYKLPTISLQDEEAVANRVDEYFAICAKNDMKPSVASLALALGVNRKYLWEIRTGNKGKNPRVADLLKKAVDFLDSQMVDYMQNGKINPVSGIFIMKNTLGYTDKQEVVITPNTPLGDEGDEKQLEEKYNDSIIIDEYEEKD